MKVKELIKLLQKANPNDVVVMSKDPEGNHYAELYDVNANEYNYDDGEIGIRNLSLSLEKDGFSEDDVLEGKGAVILWPDR